MDFENVVKRFQEMRASNSHCDYTITSSDGQVFNVHKSYIVATSDYFAAMLDNSSSMIETQSSHVTLHNIHSSGLTCALDYMYGIDQLDVAISLNNFMDILTAASMLQLEDIIFKCAEFMTSSTDQSNFIEMRRICVLYGLNEAMQTIDDYIISVPQHLCTILHSDDVSMLYEDMGDDFLIQALNASAMTPTVKLKCIHKYSAVKKLPYKPNSKLYHLAFFLYCFLMTAEAKAVIDSIQKNCFQDWFAQLQADAFTHLAKPIHQQVLDCREIMDVRNHINSLLIVGNNNAVHFAQRKQYPLYDVYQLKDIWPMISSTPGAEVQTVAVNNYMLCSQHKAGCKQCHIFNPRNFKYEEIAHIPNSYMFDHLVACDYEVFSIGYHYMSATMHVLKYHFEENQWSFFMELPVELNDSPCTVGTCVQFGQIFITLYNKKSDSSQLMCLNPTLGSITELLPNFSSQSPPIMLLYEGSMYVELRRHDKSRTYKVDIDVNSLPYYQTQRISNPVIKQIMAFLTQKRVWIGDRLFYKPNDIGAIRMYSKSRGAISRVMNLNGYSNVDMVHLKFPHLKGTYLEKKVVSVDLNPLLLAADSQRGQAESHSSDDDWNSDASDDSTSTEIESDESLDIPE